MKFSAIFAVVAVAIASVGALVPVETNAHRLARGLTPRAPRSLVSRTETARRSHTSGDPGRCNTGSIQCCQSEGKASDNFIGILLELLGIHGLDENTQVGVTCSPVSLVGGEGGCSSKPVCCENNSYNGIVAVGCSPVKV